MGVRFTTLRDGSPARGDAPSELVLAIVVVAPQGGHWAGPVSKQLPQESKLEQDAWAWLLPQGREVTGKQVSEGLNGNVWARGE